MNAFKLQRWGGGCVSGEGDGDFDLGSTVGLQFQQGGPRSSFICPAGTYATRNGVDPRLRECKPCHASCVSCSGPRALECTKCVTNDCHTSHCPAAVKPILSRGECVSACPVGLYADPATAKCKPCHSTCKACSGPSRQQCIDLTGSPFRNEDCALAATRRGDICFKYCSEQQATYLVTDHVRGSACTPCEAELGPCQAFDAASLSRLRSPTARLNFRFASMMEVRHRMTSSQLHSTMVLYVDAAGLGLGVDGFEVSVLQQGEARTNFSYPEQTMVLKTSIANLAAATQAAQARVIPSRSSAGMLATPTRTPRWYA